jgi:hypothetical protein
MRFIEQEKKHPLTRRNIVDVERDFIDAANNRYNPKRNRKVEFRGYQSNLSEHQIELLFNQLIDSYIDSEISLSSFKLMFEDDLLPQNYCIIWKKSNVLLAYFIKKLFFHDNFLSFWKKAELIFKIKNLAQSETNNPHPKGHEKIDLILKTFIPI